MHPIDFDLLDPTAAPINIISHEAHIRFANHDIKLGANSP
jgi:hypothetical protein